jgi:hypothetical protein
MISPVLSSPHCAAADPGSTDLISIQPGSERIHKKAKLGQLIGLVKVSVRSTNDDRQSDCHALGGLQEGKGSNLQLTGRNRPQYQQRGLQANQKIPLWGGCWRREIQANQKISHGGFWLARFLTEGSDF